MDFKLIIAGSRNFNNYQLLKEKLDFFLKNIKDKIEIVSGTCRGADILGEKYANKKGYSLKRFPANWGKYHKAAGPIRNKEMAEYADALVLFWQGEDSNSRGSRSMLKEAKKRNLLIREVIYGPIS